MVSESPPRFYCGGQSNSAHKLQLWLWKHAATTSAVEQGGREREREYACVCVCVCLWLWVRERVCACVCACVCFPSTSGISHTAFFLLKKRTQKTAPRILVMFDFALSVHPRKRPLFNFLVLHSFVCTAAPETRQNKTSQGRATGRLGFVWWWSDTYKAVCTCKLFHACKVSPWPQQLKYTCQWRSFSSRLVRHSLVFDWLMIAYIVLLSALLSRLIALACGSTWVTSFL